ncbi:MAG: glycosyltransferase [Chloroflexi bacterium]|nr:glycosyltransferase [Chloroflexota bacterium]
MIVKNESKVIQRCLASVRGLIDAWAIVDTGSVDGTQTLIRDALRDLPGELLERPWVNFGHNRTEALQLARGRADYVLVIDADEELVQDPGFELPELSADAYTAEVFYSGCTYLRRQLVRNALPWRYEGVLHEYITCEDARNEEFIAGMRTVVHTDGARSSDPHKFRRDALVLEQALLDDPQNSRYAFYLAQSYRDAGDTDLALRWYQRRVELGGWPEEVWFSLYQIAALEQAAQKPWADVVERYLRAYQFNPSRAEPLFRIALGFQARREYHTSMLFLERAAHLPIPPTSALFVERPLYEVQIPLEHAVAAYYVGDHQSAVATCNQLLRSSTLPAALVEHVISNRRFSLDARVPPTSATLPAAGPQRIDVVVVFRDPGPELDDLVESLLRQELTELHVTFIDDGSATDQRARLPLDDARFSLVRRAAPCGFDAAVREMSRSLQGVIVALRPTDRLADGQALGEVAAAFTDPRCQLLYAQFRRADGGLGDAEPAESDAAFAARGPACASRSPLIFRASLASEIDLGTDQPLSFRTSPASELDLGADQPPFVRDSLASELDLGADRTSFFTGLWHAAGFAGTRFSDRVLTVAAPERPPRVALRNGAPPTSTPRLPTISCLMVTYDRLVLAKRALRSFAEQTWTNRELVVVTDGPPRFRRALETEAAAAGLTDVRFVCAAEGTCLGALRNLALDAARGELVCQWDDDDYSHPERLETQASYLFRHNADACFLTEHLQYLDDQRAAFWVDWTNGGRQSGLPSWFPGTVMMRHSAPIRYPESGPYARTGEDTMLMQELAAKVPVVGLGGNAHLYLYQYHGRNAFSREHHEQLRVWAADAGSVSRDERRIRETLIFANVPRPTVVAGRDEPAFVIA